MREERGLNDPIYQQYATRYISKFAQGTSGRARAIEAKMLRASSSPKSGFLTVHLVAYSDLANRHTRCKWDGP